MKLPPPTDWEEENHHGNQESLSSLPSLPSPSFPGFTEGARVWWGVRGLSDTEWRMTGKREQLMGMFVREPDKGGTTAPEEKGPSV